MDLSGPAEVMHDWAWIFVFLHKFVERVVKDVGMDMYGANKLNTLQYVVIIYAILYKDPAAALTLVP